MFDGTKHCHQQVKLQREMVLEDLYKSKLQDSVQLPDCIGPVRARDNSKQWPTEIFKD